MRFRISLTALLAALALVGCGDDDDRTPSSPPVAADAFCTEFVDSFCDRIARCDCSPTADADCRADLTETCGRAEGILGTETRARIASGKVTYDAASAGAFFARVRSSTSCENPLVELGWTFSDLISFGGTFRGTTMPGGACATANTPIGGECATGLCQETGTGNVCIGLAGPGAACGMDIPFLCANTSAPFTGFDDPDILLRCDIAMGATTGTCAARLANGAACANRTDCASSLCAMDVCAPKLANGATCDGDEECDSAFCRGDTMGQTCATPSNAAIGAACMADSDCGSDQCRDGACVAAICGLYSPPPPPPTS